MATFDNQTLDEARWLVDLDLWSVIYATKAFLPVMHAQNEGWLARLLPNRYPDLIPRLL